MSLAEVLARSDVWRGDQIADAPLPTVASGFDALDAELPGGGWPRGALTEILLDGAGLGEVSLLLPTLVRLREAGGWSLLVAPPHGLHAPAWAAAGVDLARLVVVCPLNGPDRISQADVLWSAEQALASGAPDAVLCWAGQLDPRHVRRLQVAAAGSRSLAFLLRPTRAVQESSVAPLRLRLSAGPQGSLGVQLLKRRGPPCVHSLHLEIPRPAKWPNHEYAMAGAASAAAAARSPRPAACA